MISFKANFVQKAPIQKIFLGKEYNSEASFVEFVSVSKNDQRTLDKLSVSWCGQDGSFASNIADDFRYMFKNGTPEKRFFALTEQKRNFSNLNEIDILGLMEITPQSNKRFKIDYLQVCPAYDYHYAERNIKHIGKAIMDSIKKILANKEIILQSALGAVGFYEKQGFKKTNGQQMIFRPKI